MNKDEIAKEIAKFVDAANEMQSRRFTRVALKEEESICLCGAPMQDGVCSVKDCVCSK